MNDNQQKNRSKKRTQSRRTIGLILALLAAAAGLSACGSSAPASGGEPVSKDGYYLDTICSITIYRMKDEDDKVKDASKMSEEAEEAIDKAFDLCRDLEDTFSRTRKGSDISRVNEAGGEWTEVSDITAEIVQLGRDYSELSGGQFDITIGGVTELWDFHAAEGKEKLPDEKELAEAVKHVDYKKLEIDGNKIRLRDPEAKIDLGGIAKGFIGDRMTESLESDGAVSAIINLGGNVICIGGKTDEDDYVVGVEAPFSDRTEIIGKIRARDKTLVTSGVYERKIEVDGKLYHHILSTETGWPVETDLDAVTLKSEKGHSGDIDALSTICLIKGADEGMELIGNTDGVEGVFVLKDGSIRQTENAGFEALE